MVRKTFTGQLDRLQSDLQQMGSLVVGRLDGLIAEQAKLDAGHDTIDYDDESVNRAWHEIENEAVRVLALQQPVLAGDLRLVTFTLVAAQELEQISDLGRDSAEELSYIRAAPVQLPVVPEVDQLMQLARDMVAASLQAFEQGNADLARGLAVQLSDVHQLARQLPNTLMAFAWADARSFEVVLSVVEVVNLWERIANHAVEIGERVLFLLTDRHEELHSARRALLASDE